MDYSSEFQNASVEKPNLLLILAFFLLLLNDETVKLGEGASQSGVNNTTQWITFALKRQLK